VLTEVILTIRKKRRANESRWAKTIFEKKRSDLSLKHQSVKWRVSKKNWMVLSDDGKYTTVMQWNRQRTCLSGTNYAYREILTLEVEDTNFILLKSLIALMHNFFETFVKLLFSSSFSHDLSICACSYTVHYDYICWPAVVTPLLTSVLRCVVVSFLLQ